MSMAMQLQLWTPCVKVIKSRPNTYRTYNYPVFYCVYAHTFYQRPHYAAVLINTKLNSVFILL